MGVEQGALLGDMDSITVRLVGGMLVDLLRDHGVQRLLPLSLPVRATSVLASIVGCDLLDAGLATTLGGVAACTLDLHLLLVSDSALRLDCTALG